MSYLRKHVPNVHETIQTQPIPGSGQVKNNAGGFAWQIDAFSQLDRFLILGSEGGSFYQGEAELTNVNVEAVRQTLDADWRRTVDRIVQISSEGRAVRQDAGILALSMAASHSERACREYALAQVEKVCRTHSTLMTFMDFLSKQRQYGGYVHKMIQRRFLETPVKDLAYQVIKYQNRANWSNKGLLQIGRPKPRTQEQQDLFRWVVKGWESVGPEEHPVEALRQVWAFETMKRLVESDEKRAAQLIADYDLPRECVPTHFLNSREVWEALNQNMPITALVRNLATMTRVKLLTPGSEGARRVIAKVTDQDLLVRGRVHPISLLIALRTYAAGRGVRGTNTWSPVQDIADALDSAFYLAFKAVEPSSARKLLALDVSGSMWGGSLFGIPGFSPLELEGAMALVSKAVDYESTQLVAFSHQLVDLRISPKMRLDTVLKIMKEIPMGGTDCALPIAYALQNNLDIDGFGVSTDSETWAGRVHPAQALKAYRQARNLPHARMAVLGMTAARFSIADPKDPGMLDIAGADSATPALMANFLNGKL